VREGGDCFGFEEGSGVEVEGGKESVCGILREKKSI